MLFRKLFLTLYVLQTVIATFPPPCFGMDSENESTFSTSASPPSSLSSILGSESEGDQNPNSSESKDDPKLSTIKTRKRTTSIPISHTLARRGSMRGISPQVPIAKKPSFGNRSSTSQEIGSTPPILKKRLSGVLSISPASQETHSGGSPRTLEQGSPRLTKKSSFKNESPRRTLPDLAEEESPGTPRLLKRESFRKELATGEGAKASASSSSDDSPFKTQKNEKICFRTPEETEEVIDLSAGKSDKELSEEAIIWEKVAAYKGDLNKTISTLTRVEYPGDFLQCTLNFTDKHNIFLNSLDDIYFKDEHFHICKASCKFLGGSFESLAAFGVGPTTLFLTGKLLEGYLPIGSGAAIGIVATVIATLIPVCAFQGAERAQKILNSINVFRSHPQGFVTLVDDQIMQSKKKKQTEENSDSEEKPDLTSIDVTLKPHKAEVPYLNFLRAYASFRAILEALLPTFIFLDAEKAFPAFAYSFIAPLIIFYFDYTYSNVFEWGENYLYKNMTPQSSDQNFKDRKKVLKESLNRMQTLINADNSDELVDKIYNALCETLEIKTENGENHKIEIGTFSKFCILFLNSVNDFLSHRYSDAEQDGTRSLALEEDTRLIPSGYMNSCSISKEGIDNISKISGSAFLSLSMPARIIVGEYVAQLVLKFLGFNSDIAFYTGLGIAIVKTLAQTVEQWKQQQKILSKAHNSIWKNQPFWLLKLGGVVTSAANALFFTLPSIAILDESLGQAPPWTKFILIALLCPGDFASFFNFLKEKMNGLLASLTTTYIKTTVQKRAYVDKLIIRAKKELKKWDKPTVNNLYTLIFQEDVSDDAEFVAQ